MSNGFKLTSLFLTAIFGVAACVADLSGGPEDGSASPPGSGGSNNGSGGRIAGGGGGTNGGVGGNGGSTGGVSGGGGLRTGSGGTNGGGSGGTVVGTGGRGGTGAGGSGAGGSASGTGGRGAGGSSMGGSGMGGASMGGATGTLACGKPGPEYTNDGSVTFYTFSQGMPIVHCSYLVTGQNPDVIAHIPTGNGQYFAAMNTGDYNGAHTCGACVEVTRDGSRSVVATVVDECPLATNSKCVRGHIDLSMNAFLQIGTEIEGFLGTGNTLQSPRATVGSISWRYVPCPVTGDAFARIKPGNQNEIFFENLVAPIKGVTMNGQASTVLQVYNGWNFGTTNIPAGANFVVTDIDNSVINFSLASAAQNADQDTGKKFATCQ